MDSIIKNNLISIANNQYMNKYLDQCNFYIENPTKKSKYEFHHIYPSFIFRENKGLKNRANTISLLDNEYKPEINVVKLPCKWHVLVHWNLANALRNTKYQKDAENSFRLLLGDFYTPWNEFNYEDINNLAIMYEETCNSNSLKEYLTIEEKKKLLKEKNK